MDYAIALDVGGTYIKSAALSSRGELLTEMCQDPARSEGSADGIMGNFHTVIKSLMDRFPSGCLTGVGFAFPGPFDYGRGISLMKGIGKYDSIYGLPLKDGICSIDPLSVLPSVPFAFSHDVESFAMGLPESLLKRTMCVCIGTGAGSAFVGNGVVLREPEDGVPENGWIYRIPFKDGIIDDYISARGEDRLAERVFGHVIDGRQLELLAGEGDGKAKQVFSLFGDDLLMALKPVIDAFKPETVVFGGQIANSFHYFGHQVELYAKERGIRIVTMPHTSETIMKGLARNMGQRKPSRGLDCLTATER